MRKWITLLTACIMMLTLCMGSGVSAATDEDYPFVFNDFEDGTLGTVTQGSTSGVAYQKGGAANSAGSAKVTVSTGNWSDLKVTHLPAVPSGGAKLHMSAWIRLDDNAFKNNCKNVAFIFYATVNTHKTDPDVAGDDLVKRTGWIEFSAPAALTVGEWTYVSVEREWDGKILYGAVAGYDGVTKAGGNASTADIEKFDSYSIRVGAAAGINNLEDPTKGSFTYSIDDWGYEVIPVDGTPIVGKESVLPNGDFENGSSAGWGSSVSSEIKEYAPGESPNGSDHYLQLKQGTTPNFAQLSTKMVWEANHLYHVEFWYKMTHMREDATATGCGAWLLQIADKKNTADTNGYNSGYPGHTETGSLTDWNHADFYYVHEYKTFANDSLDTWLRLFPTEVKIPKTENGEVVYEEDGETPVMVAYDAKNNVFDADYAIDGLKMEDLGAVSNGDFSLTEKDVYKHSKKETQLFPGWTPTGAEVAADTRGENSAMKVTLAEDNGYVYQGLSLANHTKYTLSFWAKSNSVSDDTEVPFAFVLDRKVASPGGDKECYDVPNYEYYVGNAEPLNDEASWNDSVKENQSFKLGNDWKYYELTIDNNFDLKSDMTAIANVIPRLPFMYLKVDGATVGTSYSLANVVLSTCGTENIPVVSNLQLTGNVNEGVISPNKTFGVSYDFSGKNGATDQHSIVRLYTDFNGHVVSLGTFSAKDTVTVPETAIGKTLKIELFPIDSNGKSGKKLQTTLQVDDYGVVAYGGENCDVRLYSDTDRNAAQVIFVSYQSGKMLDVKAVSTGDVTAHKVCAVAAPENFVTAGADSVRAFVWNTTNGLEPIVSPVSLTIAD